MPSTLEAASGRWPELLCALGGISAEDLCDREGPCPSCFVLAGDAGNTRFKWDDDDGPGGWFCSHCGGKGRQGGGGTGVDLLMRLRDWDLTQALRHVDGYLGGDRTAAPAIATPAARPKKPKRPARIPDVPPAGTQPPDLGRAVAQFPYGPDPENPWFWIQRIPMEPKRPGGKLEKLFVHRTWLDGQWHWPSLKDAFTSEWPAPRPLFNLPYLLARPNAPVLVVEGEGKSLAAVKLAPGHVIVSGCGGTGGINAVDWTPLAGRTVLLWPDNDDAGRQFMAKLGLRLQQLGATVSVIIPPASLGLPPKWDAADAAERWGPKEFDALVRQHSRPLDRLNPPHRRPPPQDHQPNRRPPPTAPTRPTSRSPAWGLRGTPITTSRTKQARF